VFVALLVSAGGLLVATAQGPGTVDLAIAHDPTQAPRPMGDAAVRRAATPVVAVSTTPSPAPSGPTSRPPEKLRGYRWPMQRKARISSYYDWRDTGFLSIDGRRVHEGLDMTTFCGDVVRAAHEGVVLAAGRRFYHAVGFSEPVDRFYQRLERRGRMSDLPNAVVIDDGNGYRSVYVHLSDTTVEPGDRVKAGTVIGHEGDTGNASGCHLHYELIRMDGPWMSVAKERVREDGYPPLVRERVDPLRVLSLSEAGAARIIPGVDPPRNPPRLKGTSGE
jgi:murein DD-endopeptidase MepM/ murein hydrolase activator NlpD